MSKQNAPSKGTTPPKGHATRTRDGYYGERKLFGPRLQWLLVVVVIVVLFLTLAIMTGPFSSNNSPHGVIVPLGASLAGSLAG